MPFIYLAMPFTALIENPSLAKASLFAIWLCKSLCVVFAFPCCTILLTNSASSLKVLGTVNGIATSIGAIGRAVGPTITGAAFSWGVRNGYIVTPFWLITALGVLAWPPIYFVHEGKGFGGDDEDDVDESLLDPFDSDGSIADDEDEEGEDEDEDEADDPDAVLEGPSPASTLRLTRTRRSRTSTRSIPGRYSQYHRQSALSNRAYKPGYEFGYDDVSHERNDEVGPLLRATTDGSGHLITRYDTVPEDVLLDTTTDDDDGDGGLTGSSLPLESRVSRYLSSSPLAIMVSGPPSRLLSPLTTNNHRNERREGDYEELDNEDEEKRARRTRRRRSSPAIGTGPGFRRLSSNLGVSRCGLGSGGEL